MVICYKGHVYLRPYIYSFCQIFPPLRLLVHKGYLDGYLLHRTCVFKALRLLFLPNFPGPTFIPCPTSIPEARVTAELPDDKVFFFF